MSAARPPYAVVVSDQGLGGIIPIGDALHTLGYRSALITGPASAEQLATWHEHHDIIEVVDNPYSVETLKTATRRVPGPLAGLFSCYDGCLLPAALAAAALGLPHCDPAALRRARNKYEARLRLREAGVDRVPAALVGLDSDLAAVERELGPYPYIVKPVNGIASHLVVKCGDRPELADAVRRLRDTISHDRTELYTSLVPLGDGGYLNPATEFLAEPFLSGTEYAAELVVSPTGISRIVLLQKLMVDDVSFFELGFISVHDPAVSEPIWQFIEAAVLGIGLDSAMCHVEVIATAEGVSLVEINAGRPGGGLVPALARGAVGRDELIETVRAALFRWSPERVATEYALPAGMVISYPPSTGVIERIEGIQECRGIPGVVLVSPFLQPGGTVQTMDRETIGVTAVTAGLDPDGVRHVHRQLEQNLRYVMEQR